MNFRGWLLSGLGFSGLGGVADEILHQIQTNTFVGNHDISLDAGIWLTIFTIGFFGFIMSVLWSKRE